jgi:superfamily II DNA/RNA helicase
VHRSGRTGRAGADGTVFTLVGREHHKDVRALQKALRMPQRVDEPRKASRGRRPAPAGGPGGGASRGPSTRSA